MIQTTSPKETEFRKILLNIVEEFEAEFVIDGHVHGNPDPLLRNFYFHAKEALK
jgi:hypothetical protein